MIVNGLHFPFQMVDKVIEKVEQSGRNLTALFLLAGNEVPEGYVFPSDIDAAKALNDEEDVREDTEDIMHDQLEYFKHVLSAKGIQGNAVILVDPSLEDIMEKINDAVIVYTSRDIEQHGLLTAADFKIPELREKLNCPLELVDH